jgi:hypothetical protein
MGYESRFGGRSRTSVSEERIRELEEKVEQQKREAIDANAMHQQQLTERGKMQESALEEMQRKQQEELAAMKKIQKRIKHVKRSKRNKTTLLASSYGSMQPKTVHHR